MQFITLFYFSPAAMPEVNFPFHCQRIRENSEHQGMQMTHPLGYFCRQHIKSDIFGEQWIS